MPAWNHNVHYHAVLLGSVPRPCRRALDVGCGLGAFARKLASVCEHVDAIDRDATAVRRAKALAQGVANVRFVESDFMTWDERGYDFVAMIASLHHLPFAMALKKAAASLRPGGVLAVLGLHRSTLFDYAMSAVAFPVSYAYRLTRGVAEVGAPVAEPAMTLREIRRASAEAVPGAAIRRHLLWRYSLRWSKGAR